MKTKKVPAIILAAVMVLFLAACGANGDNDTPISDNTDAETPEVSIPSQTQTVTPTPSLEPDVTVMTKAEMLAVAEEVTSNEIYEAFQENSIRAEETYIGKIISYSGYVGAVESDFVLLGSFRIYLQREDLAKLNRSERVQIVGVLDNAVIETGAFEVYVIDAYYIDNIFEITGTISMGYNPIIRNGRTDNRIGNPEGWYFTITTPNGDIYNLDEDVPVNHVNNLATSSVIINDEIVADGDNVTVSGRIVNTYMRDGGRLEDGKIKFLTLFWSFRTPLPKGG